MKHFVLFLIFLACTAECVSGRSRRGLLIEYSDDSEEINVYNIGWNGMSHVVLTNYTRGYSVTCYESGDVALHFKSKKPTDFEYVPITDTAVEAYDKLCYRSYGRNAWVIGAERLKDQPRVYLSSLEWELLARAYELRKSAGKGLFQKCDVRRSFSL